MLFPRKKELIIKSILLSFFSADRGLRAFIIRQLLKKDRKRVVHPLTPSPKFSRFFYYND